MPEHEHHDYWWVDEPGEGGKTLICKGCGAIGYAIRPVMVDGEVKWVIMRPDGSYL
jgi:hypothetical protein